MRPIMFAAATLAVLTLFLGSGADRSAIAAEITIEGVATGAEEVPAVTGPGSARARLVFDDETNDLSYAVTVNGLSPSLVTAAHIHKAPAGTNGPVVYPLSTTGFTQVAGTIALTDEDVADLRAGNLYLNVHSTANPGGFARLQLVLPAETITPPSTGNAGLRDETTTRVGGLALLALTAVAVVLIGRSRLASVGTE